MPVPQENSLFVEQASCLFLRMVQDVRYLNSRLTISRSFLSNKNQRSLGHFQSIAHLHTVVKSTQNHLASFAESNRTASINSNCAKIPLTFVSFSKRTLKSSFQTQTVRYPNHNSRGQTLVHNVLANPRTAYRGTSSGVISRRHRRVANPANPLKTLAASRSPSSQASAIIQSYDSDRTHTRRFGNHVSHCFAKIALAFLHPLVQTQIRHRIVNRQLKFSQQFRRTKIRENPIVRMLQKLSKFDRMLNARNINRPAETLHQTVHQRSTHPNLTVRLHHRTSTGIESRVIFQQLAAPHHCIYGTCTVFQQWINFLQNIVKRFPHRLNSAFTV